MAGMTAAFCIFLTFFSRIRMYSLAQLLRKSAVSSRATNFGRVCTKMSRQSLYFSYSKHKLITQSTVGFIACASNKNSDESAHLSILARAIQNISAFRRHRHAINGGFYFMCEQPESSDESAHVSSLARTFATPIQNISAFKSHRQFRHAINRLHVRATKAQTSMRI